MSVYPNPTITLEYVVTLRANLWFRFLVSAVTHGISFLDIGFDILKLCRVTFRVPVDSEDTSASMVAHYADR